MRYHIIKRAVESDVFVSDKDLIDIMYAELIYLELNGQLGNAGELLN